MELEFNKVGSRWEAEFEATGNFNLHIERKKAGGLAIYQKASADDKYATDSSWSDNAPAVVNEDFSMLIYPKMIKVTSRSEPIQGIVTMEGEGSSSGGSTGGYKVPNGMQFLNNFDTLEIPTIDTSECVFLNYFAKNLNNLQRINGLDLSSCKSTIYMIPAGTSYALLKNLGAAEDAYALNFYAATSWGQGNEENRKSLIDSLLTYSFDRKSAGYSDLYVWLSPGSFNLITSEELQQMQAKGIQVGVGSNAGGE